MKSRILQILVLIHLGTFYIFSQGLDLDSLPNERPKIGLVLSGGAAHGFAHVGVIKYLEELEIPIDYITGTSMGAVVGGIYAMGYDYHDMLKVTKSQDWSLILGNTIPLQEVAVTEKEHHQKNPYYLLWTGTSFELPKGLIGGQKMDLILSKIYCPAFFVEDYDDLPIPYRCLAVDLLKGDVVTLDEGYLGKSIRASMAIPSVFPPVESGDRLFVDGGLLRNFPAEENLLLGSDILIGSYVGGRQKSKEELNSLLAILGQSAGMAGILDSEQQASLIDILINPNTEEFKNFDFPKYEELIRIGYQTAQENGDQLRELANIIKQYPSRDKPIKLEQPAKMKISKIVLHTSDRTISEMILGELPFKEGDDVTLEDIEMGASNIFGTNYFSKVSYNFFPYIDGIGLEIITIEKEPVKIGLNINRFQHYNASFIFNAEARNILVKPTRLNLAFRVSEKPGLDFLYQYKYLRNPNWIVQLRAIAEEFDLPFYNDAVATRRFTNRDAKFEVSILNELNNSSLVKIGYRNTYDRLRPQVQRPDQFNKLKSRRRSIFFNYQFNNLNSASFATKGVRFEFDTDYVFDLSYQRLAESDEGILNNLEWEKNISFNINAEFNTPISEVTTLKNHISLDYNSNGTIFDHKRIGGSFQYKNETLGMVGFKGSELLVGNHAYLNTQLQIKLNDIIYLLPTISVLYAEDLLNGFYSRDEPYPFIFSAGVEIAIKTPIGPVSFDMGYSDHTAEFRTNLGIGYRHIY